MDTRAWRLTWPPGFSVFEVDSQQVLDFKHEVLSQHDESTHAEAGTDKPAGTDGNLKLPQTSCAKRAAIAADASKAAGAHICTASKHFRAVFVCPCGHCFCWFELRGCCTASKHKSMLREKRDLLCFHTWPLTKITTSWSADTYSRVAALMLCLLLLLPTAMLPLLLLLSSVAGGCYGRQPDLWRSLLSAGLSAAIPTVFVLEGFIGEGFIVTGL